MAEQHCLDPQRVASAVLPPDRVGPLPEKVRKFGRIPDLLALRAGDLILSSPISSRIGESIAAVQQKAGYSVGDARWTHAAVYLGVRDCIVEAVPRDGVRFASLWDRATDHLLRFRRPVAAAAEPVVGWQISVNAALLVGTSYSFSEILQIFGRARQGWWKTHATTPRLKDALICSVVYGDAFSAATGLTLRNEGAKETSPAFLSHTKLLIDIPISWRSVD